MGRKGDSRTTVFVDAAVEVGARHLVRVLGVSEPTARDLMTTIAWDICGQFARTTLYIPALLELQRTERDRRISNAYAAAAAGDGSRPYTHARIVEIAAAEQLTVRQVYDILKLERQRDLADRQQQLPGLDPA